MSLSPLAEELGLTDEEVESLDLEFHTNTGNSGQMPYNYYFEVPEGAPVEILEKKGWKIGETIEVSLSALDDSEE